MDEILHWFQQQHSGVRSYQTLLQKISDYGRAEPGKTALVALLVGIIRPFIASYAEMPLSVEVAEKAHAVTADLLNAAAQMDELPPAAQLDLLNSIAFTELE